LTFDAEQITQVLLFDFTKNGQQLIETQGRYAGCIPLNQDDQIHVQITMTDTGEYQDDFIVEGFQIIGLDVVSQPNVTENELYLSPFKQDSATVNLQEGWVPVEKIHDEETGATLYRTYLDSGFLLPVVAEKGFWKVSGFLSVRVIGRQGTEVLSIPRVFSFDPEVVSGGRRP
ncbi:MAG: hypothetical protein AB3N28_06230, partial [Kordiimonas sp.]